MDGDTGASAPDAETPTDATALPDGGAAAIGEQARMHRRVLFALVGAWVVMAGVAGVLFLRVDNSIPGADYTLPARLFAVAYFGLLPLAADRWVRWRSCLKRGRDLRWARAPVEQVISEWQSLVSGRVRWRRASGPCFLLGGLAIAAAVVVLYAASGSGSPSAGAWAVSTLSFWTGVALLCLGAIGVLAGRLRADEPASGVDVLIWLGRASLGSKTPAPWDAVQLPQPTQPGWSPDPYGLPMDRWWDGAGWSDRVRAPATTHPAEAMQEHKAPVPAPPRRRILRLIRRASGVALLGLALVFTVGNLVPYLGNTESAADTETSLVVVWAVCGPLAVLLLWPRRRSQTAATRSDTQ